MVQLFHNHTSQSYACPVADLGFLRRGRGQTRGGGINLLLGKMFSENCMKMKLDREHWWIQGSGARGARSPLGTKFFHFHAVFGKKKLPNNRLAHPLWELAPLQENPGSATREGKQWCLILIGKTDHVDVSNTVIFVFNPRRKCRCWVKLLVKFKMKPMFLNIMHLSFFMYFNAYYIPMVNWVVESITVQEMFL